MYVCIVDVYVGIICIIGINKLFCIVILYSLFFLENFKEKLQNTPVLVTYSRFLCSLYLTASIIIYLIVDETLQ